MKKANLIATIALTVLALLAWIGTAATAFMSFVVPSAYLLGSSMLTLAACLGWILLNLSPSRLDEETRCRRCRYILRGLSEPRCPECGERI